MRCWPRNQAPRLVIRPAPGLLIRVTVLNAGNQLFTAELLRSIARENAGKSTTLKSDGKPDTTQ
jgi:hypothetical protein